MIIGFLHERKTCFCTYIYVSKWHFFSLEKPMSKITPVFYIYICAKKHIFRFFLLSASAAPNAIKTNGFCLLFLHFGIPISLHLFIPSFPSSLPPPHLFSLPPSRISRKTRNRHISAALPRPPNPVPPSWYPSQTQVSLPNVPHKHKPSDQ